MQHAYVAYAKYFAYATCICRIREIFRVCNKHMSHTRNISLMQHPCQQGYLSGPFSCHSPRLHFCFHIAIQISVAILPTKQEVVNHPQFTSPHVIYATYFSCSSPENYLFFFKPVWLSFQAHTIMPAIAVRKKVVSISYFSPGFRLQSLQFF